MSYNRLDVDETHSEMSHGSFSVTGRCADVNLRVIGILVQTESMTVNDQGQLRTYNSGPSTDPCGTPNSTDCTEDS